MNNFLRMQKMSFKLPNSEIVHNLITVPHFARLPQLNY